MERNIMLQEVEILYFYLLDIWHAYVYVYPTLKCTYHMPKEINTIVNKWKKSSNLKIYLV